MSDITTIAQAAALIEKRALSPVELLDRHLARIAQCDGRLHAFIRLMAEQARDEARQAEVEIMRGQYRGPLHGIPIGVKDIYDVAGVPTTANSRIMKGHVAARDATAIRKLREAGAIVVGKLNTAEFAFGSSPNSPWPLPRNPWDLERFTGGSSSGTAAAIAAGLVLGGTGSDTGGSIRVPAAYCGIAGLKPTYGRVSRAGILPLAYSLDHAGPMAKTAEDCALLLQAMAGHDPADPASADRGVPDYRAALSGSVKGLRVGIVRHFFETDNPADAQTQRALESAIGVLRDLGCVIGDVTLSPLADYGACGYVMLLAEGYTLHAPTLRARYDDYAEVFRGRIVLGALTTAADYIEAQRLRRLLAAEMTGAMTEYDLLLTAITPAPAPPAHTLDIYSTFDKPHHSFPFNITGQPALALCCGFSTDNLPLAFQIAGRPFDEATVLKVAHHYERATGWSKRAHAL